MRIILFSRRQLAHTSGELRLLFATIDRFGFDYMINTEFAELVKELAGIEIPADKIYGQLVPPQPEGSIMICYGGDGTLLEGVYRLGNAAIPILGINAGHLGFLTSAPSDGLDQIFGDLIAGKIRIEQRSMLQIDGTFSQRPSSLLALNEFSIQRNGAGMISVETYVDNEMVATYHGDGVIISTPTGSTAYSLSAGGPVVVPSCSCLIISPLAPHNLTMRPVVIPDSATISMRIHSRHADAFITLDNRTYSVASETSFTIKRAEKAFFLALPHNISFYDTLRNKMMWGVDIRS
ncbi:MAG: NADH kinase [Rikenellaceae bacterium]|nr:NADH kinase [Rikenellaceae bacterium]